MNYHNLKAGFRRIHISQNKMGLTLIKDIKTWIPIRARALVQA